MKILHPPALSASNKLALTLLVLSGLLMADSSRATEARVSPYGSAWAKTQAQPAVSAFAAWTTRFSGTPTTARSQELISEGVALAKNHRAAIADLIRSDPAKALSLTVPASVRQQLPPEVEAQLEQRVSGIGNLIVLGAMPAKGGPAVEPIRRSVYINGKTYRGFVYGRRLNQTSKYQIPLNGIAVDGNLALSDASLRVLEPGESLDSTKSVVNLAGSSPSVAAPVFAELDGKIYRFASAQDLQQGEARLEANEAGLGPSTLQPSVNLLDPGSAGVQKNNLPTAWTTGLKKVLVIRVDFSDMQGDPIDLTGGVPDTAAYVQGIMDTQVGPYYPKSSYGLTSMTNTVTTQLYRMPQTASYYATGGLNDQLHADAETLAAADYRLSDYERIIVFFGFMGALPNSLITYGGLAMVGSTNVWINGEFDFRVVTHELGHTYGLYHAGLWLVDDGNPISANGTTVEYGDDFDTMGANYANDQNTDFNPYYKNILGWLADNQVQNISSNGVYRLYTFDWINMVAAPNDRPLALRIRKDNEHTYWLGVRRNFTGNAYMQNGIYVIWGLGTLGAGGGGGYLSQLLDMGTPGISPFLGANSDYDAALTMGTTFFDPANNFMVTPLQQGGTAPNYYVDIQIGPPEAPPPNLTIDSDYIKGGNGDGIIEFNECNDLFVVLTNTGGGPATSVEVTLSTTTPGVIIAQPTAAYPNINTNSTGTNTLPFRISTAPEFTCGLPIILSVLIKCDQSTTTNQLALSTGLPGTPLRFDNPNFTFIPDRGTAVSSVLVSNLDFAANKIAVSLFITHTFDADLLLQLVSPDGVTNTLSRNNGSNGQNYGLGCSPDAQRTTFDDDAAVSVTNGTAPFLGSYRPEEPLVIFAGKSGTNLNGLWQLVVSDQAQGDFGAIQCWSLLVTPTVCTNGGGECPGSDLALGMKATPEPVLIGDTLTYTIAVTNFGPSAAKTVAVSQVLPPSVIFVSANCSQGSAAQAGGVVTASLGRMSGGSTATVSVVVMPAALGTISSSVTVGSEQPDFNLANNSATVVSTVNPPTSDLSVGILPAPSSLLVGGQVTYTIAVTNNGPSAASGVIVTNVFPAGVVLTGETVSQGSIAVNGTTVVCFFGGLGKGARATLAVTATPITQGSMLATATLNAHPNQFDPVLNNNSATAAIAVGPAADLVLSFTALPNPVVVSSNLTLSTTVTNRGPSPASQVVVNELLPLGITLLSSNVSQGTFSLNGTNLVWNIGALNLGASASLQLVVSTPKLGLLSGSASVTGFETDPNLANNSAALSIDVAPPFINISSAGASLTAESLQPANGSVDPEETVTVQFRLQNLGNVANTNLVVTLLPSGGVAAPSGPQTYGILKPVGIPGGVPVSRPFTFTASGSYGDVITATLNLQDGPNALSPITYTFALPTRTSFANTNPIVIPAFNPANPVTQGPAGPYPSTITVSGVTSTVGRVTVTLSNLSHTYPHDINALLVGPTGAKSLVMSHAAAFVTVPMVNQTITLDDAALAPLPDTGNITTGAFQPAAYGMSPVFSNPAPAGPYTTSLANFGGLSPNGTWSLYILDDSDGDIGSVANGWMLDLVNITPVNQVADLGLAVSTTADPVLVGNNLVYTFTVTNAGPDDATGVTFSNALPASATLVSATASQGNCLTNATLVVGNLATVPAGGFATVTVILRPTPAASGLLTNSASVSAYETDLHLPNNSVSSVVPVNLPAADLVVSSAANPATLTVGSNLLFSTTVSNTGPGVALSVEVLDPLPRGTVFRSAAVSQGSVSTNSGGIKAVLGNLVPGAAATVTLGVAPLVAGSLTNTVSVTTASLETNMLNNSAIAVALATAPAATVVAVGATLTSESFLPPNGAIDLGETVTLSLALANKGALDAADLTATLLASGGVTAPSGPQTYGLLVAGGPVVSRSYTFTASQSATNPLVVTLQLQDGAANLGTVAFSLGLPVPNVFANPASIIIPDLGAATPYPATIPVAGITGLVNKATVALNGLTHTFPSDVNVLLVSPSGRNVLLMSHAGASFGVTNLTLTFDDAGPDLLPSGTSLISGSYRPGRYGAPVAFPSPAPLPSYGTALAGLNNTDPNGLWSLYVLDDAAGDAGGIASGWTLNLTTVQPVSPLIDLGVGLASTPASVYTGNPLKYTLTITNSGPYDAQSAVLTDTLPLGLTLLSATPSQGTTSLNGNILTCDLGPLAVGSHAVVSLLATPVLPGTITNTITASSEGKDLNSANNSASVTTLVLSSTPATLAGSVAGSQFTLTITGQPGFSYAVQGSTNLTSWVSMGTYVAPSNGILRVVDTNFPSLTTRFYRTVQQ